MDECTGHRWQKEAAEFICKLSPGLVVETGVSEGVSTDFILNALDTARWGRLISIDPFTNYQNANPRWTLIKKLSVDALADVLREAGAFDVFIHDSDHEAWNMRFELEFAWYATKPNGWIFCDDITWGGYGVWDAFLAKHDQPHRKMGHAGIVQKIGAERMPPDELLKHAIAVANAFAPSSK